MFHGVWLNFVAVKIMENVGLFILTANKNSWCNIKVGHQGQGQLSGMPVKPRHSKKTRYYSKLFLPNRIQT